MVRTIKLAGAGRWVLLLCLLSFGFGINNNLYGQQLTIKGDVVDSTSAEPLPGVNIRVKGTTTGTSTDTKGHYELLVPSLQDTLVYSFIGFQTKEIPINGRTEIDVALISTTVQGEEMTVVAFGEQRKEEVVGSVTSVSPGDLNKAPSSNLTTSMAGRMAGVIAYQRSGEPGQDNADFFIRGVTTFGYKKDPLILIDGVELTSHDLAQLQPDDIASFTIMKDATATSLYGARGANGVILVKTKEGYQGQAKVSFRIENSISSPTENVQLADPMTYMKLHNESVLTRNPLGILPYSQQKIDRTAEGANPYVYPTTNWRDALFKDYTSNHRANFSVRGGGRVAQYYLAGTYTRDTGALKVDHRNNFNNNIDLKKYLLRSNVNIDLTNSTEVGVRLYGTFDDYTGPINGGEELYNKVMRTNPVLYPAYYPADEQHQYVQHILFGNYQDGNYVNPYADMTKGYKDYSRTMMLAQFEIKQDLSAVTEGLRFRAMINTTRKSFFDVIRSSQPYYYDIGFYNPQTGDYNLSLVNEGDGRDYLGYSEGPKEVSSKLYSEAALNYDQTFYDVHGVSGLLVLQLNNRIEANAGSLQRSLPHRNVGLSGRFTYNYDKRYFAEFDFGYNGSERFYTNNRFGFFPSFGAAWSVSNESFWKPLSSTITKLKVRGTYGLVGNDAIGGPEDRFFYLSNIDMDDGSRGATFGRNNGYSRSGVSISRYSNKEITWETAIKSNVALEIGLFNKLNISAEFFKEHRTNILMTRSYIPNSMGLSAPVRANVGEAQSLGTDISVDYSQYFGNKFWFSARGNFTYAHSKFLTYEEPNYNETYLSHEGQPLNQQWGYIAERLFVDDAEVANSPQQNFGEYRGGDIKYRDINGDGQITSLDRVPIGYPTSPEIVYGFGLSAGYKNFDLSFFFQGLARESFWIDVEDTAPFIDNDGDGGTISQNALLQAYANSHWSESNRNSYALWPRLSSVENTNNEQRSTWFMRDGGFLRLKTVELGYSLPFKFLRNSGVEKTRIYVSGLNLLTFSKFKLWDPEMAGNGLGYPIQRVFNAGLKVEF